MYFSYDPPSFKHRTPLKAITNGRNMFPRKVLFLQGPATPFFSRLAKKILGLGHQVQMIAFCGGDYLFSKGLPIWHCPVGKENIVNWLGPLLNENHFTDVVLFGDTRNVHHPIIKLAKKINITTWVYEEGYIRPDWVTLEKDGVNAHSQLMRLKEEWFNSYYEKPTKINIPTQSSFYARVSYDILYRCANFGLAYKYKKYVSHRPANGFAEYFGWLKRYIWRGVVLNFENKKIEKLISDEKKYFFFPLQLNSDAQIRYHSPFKSMFDGINFVMKSFSKNTDKDIFLLIKNHPLDTGLKDFRCYIRKKAKEYNISERVVYLENGHIPTLLDHCQGTVVINSTVGMSALIHNVPLCTLGTAIYNICGLTYQNGLDNFWSNATKPDSKLFSKFKNAVINLSQINGNFYSDFGIEKAIEGSIEMMGF